MDEKRKRKRSVPGAVISVSRSSVTDANEPRAPQNRSIQISRQDHNRQLGHTSTIIPGSEEVYLEPEDRVELNPWSSAFYDEPITAHPPDPEPLHSNIDGDVVRTFFPPVY